jgi:hypothetical protein
VAELLPDRRLQIRTDHQMDSTLEVETQAKALVGQIPGLRPALLGEEVRQGQVCEQQHQGRHRAEAPA